MNWSGLPLLCLLALFHGQPTEISASEDTNKLVMCYFGSWSTYRYGVGHFDVEDIDPFLCSHLVFGFAGLDKQSFVIKVLDPFNELYDEWGKGAFDRFTDLKKINPSVKTLLAIGGWNEGATAYSTMALTQESRATFIQSCLDLVLKHNFDGLDLDWEYPGGRSDSPGRPEDKENFSSLLREMRSVFDSHGLMLTAAVSAGFGTMEPAYDVPALAENLDIIALMTYDYHGWFEGHFFTGHNSPLYPMPVEMSDPEHPGYNFNVDYAVQWYIDQGAKRSQLLLGVGAYGRGFRLTDVNQNGLYAPANAGIKAGYYTGTVGFQGYNEFCELQYGRGGEAGQWTTVRDPFAVSPYAYNVNSGYWFSYEDPTSINQKADYVLANELGGMMLWSIDTDDFQNFCGQGRFPITTTMANRMSGGPATLPPDYTPPTAHPEVTDKPGVTNLPPPDDICTETGPTADPEDCQHYYVCNVGADGTWDLTQGTCTHDTLFNPAIDACDWPSNVDCQAGGNTEYPPTAEPPGTGTTPEPTTRKPFNGDVCNGQAGIVADPEDCTKFYQCTCTVLQCFATSQECSPGLAYNAEIGGCDWAANVPSCQV